MNLPFFKKNYFSKKDEHKDIFVALIIKHHHIGAILFEKVNKTLSIVSSQEKIQKKNIEQFSSEELTAAADEVISAAESNLPQNSSFEKAIFAIPYDWVIEGHIKKEYLLKLKKVCEDLALKPIGFIISIEAIVAQLQKNQGAPITCIVIEDAKDIVNIFLVKAGSVIEVKSAPIDGGIVTTVEEILKSFSSVDVFPSKLVILNSEYATGHQHAFLSHRWTHQLPFLHEPQVTTLEKSFENESIINGVAGQMGFEVFEVLQTSSITSKKNKNDILAAEDLGFLKEQDIAISKEVESHSPEELSENLDVYNTSPSQHETRKDIQHLHRHEAGKVQEEVNIENEKKPFSMDMMQVLTEQAKNIQNGIKHFQIPKLTNMIKMKSFLLIPIFLVILFGIGGYIYYNYILKSTVVIFIDRKTLDKEVKLTLSADSDTSAQDALLHLKTIEENVNESDTIVTTGKKETGEKAKGDVTIYNKTEAKKTFSKGTTIIGTNGLEFLTVDDVSIASTSAFSTNFSNAKIKVEASKFGSEYNLPSSTNFSIKDLPTSNYFAKNDSALAGGTKKNITIVSKKDIADLEQIVIESSKVKAFSQASSKIAQDEVLLSSPIAIDFKEEKFDKKENQEATKLSLTAKVGVTLGTYKRSDLDILVKELGKGTIPDEYNLARDKSNIELSDVEIGKDEEVTAMLKIKANYEPTIDPLLLAKQISGKSLSDAKNNTKKTKGVSDVTILLKNNLLILPNILPLNPNNITVEVKSE